MPIINVDTLPFTVAEFRSAYPEFQNTAVYPDAAITYWISVSTLFVNPCVWEDKFGFGCSLWTAHNLVLQQQALGAAQAGGYPGISKGAISSEGAGAVSLSYDTASVSEPDAGAYNLTTYGKEFIRYARIMGAGVFQIGGGCGAPGDVPGQINPGPAWSGPNCKPGFFGS